MILERRVARELNKPKIAKLANEFANEFGKRLGIDVDARFKSGQFFYRQKNALRHLYKKMDEVRKEQDYDVLQLAVKYAAGRAHIETDTPFFVSWLQKGEVYSPLVGLKGEEKEMVEMAGKDPADYMMLDGFGAEVSYLFNYTHLKNHALGGALDILGTLHEISANTATLKCSKRFEGRFVKEFIRKSRMALECYECLVFEGVNKLRKKLTRDVIRGLVVEDEAEDVTVKDVVMLLKEDYVGSKHFEGGKVFFAAYDQDYNLRNTFRRIGKVFSEPCDVFEALERLGCEDIGKYAKVFVDGERKKKIVRLGR